MLSKPKHKIEIAKVVSNELSSWSKKSGSKSIFTISNGNLENYKKPFIRNTNGLVISNIQISSNKYLEDIINEIYESVNYIFIDERLSNDLSKFNNIYKDKLSIFSESNSLVLALDAFLNRLDKSNSISNCGIIGINAISTQLIQVLLKQNKNIFIESKNNDAETLIISMNNILKLMPEFSKCKLDKITDHQVIDALIAFEMSEIKLLEIFQNNFANLKFVIDASLFSFSQKVITFLRQKNIEVYRLDMRAALISEVQLRLETINLVDNVCGFELFDDIRVVAGGKIGLEGDIIVDSIKNPRRIIGVADGLGGILTDLKNQIYLDRIIKVKTFILNKILNS